MTTSLPSPTLFLVPGPHVSDLPWETFPGGVGVEHKILYHADGMVAGLLRLHPGAHELSHVHLHGEHHLWVLAGAVQTEDTELPVDSYLHVPPRLRHTLQDAGQGSLLFYVFCPTVD